ncbi:hypothetical protein ONE63_004703 [Megalurothrips usitatus]|uniref:Uncharacterized protein n=1 Tax=Megalurothrips usitatus TaxID=439358 RepID=A0AAV7X6Z2_9NEOP|nr:hypothetical protein ONE63_004703 [Megalurothrips usitatus]
MPSGTRGRRGGRRAHWEADADRLVDVVITSGPPAPLDDNAEKLKFLLNFQLVTLRRRQGLELQKLLNSKGRLAPALLEVGTDVAASLSEDLQLPLPTATPRDVFEDGGRPGKAEFLLQLDLRATSDREREDSEWEWIACEAERFRCGRDCKVTRYLVTYREALHRVNMKRKRRPAPAMVQCDAPKSITPDFESLCDKLLSLPFSPMEGGSLSCVPLLKPALVQILEMLLPAELAPVLLKSIESAMPQKQDSPTTLSDPDHKNLELQQKLPVNLKERAKEVIRLQNNLSNLETEISSKTETIKGLEKLLEKLNEVKTSQDEEGRMLQASLDSLSRCWKGLKTHVRYRKLY